MQITARYGTREITREFPANARVQDVVQHPDVRVALNLPENYSALVDGRTVSTDSYLSDGDTVTFEKNAAQKAA